jgi:hypothetical protein
MHRFKLQCCIRLPHPIRGPVRVEAVRIRHTACNLCFGPLRVKNQSAMPLDKSLLNGSESSAGCSSGESEDEGNCSRDRADPNATDAESEDDGTGAQKLDEQSENGSDYSSEHTPAQRSKRECADATDEETASFRVRKSGFRRPRLQWQHVQTWNREHVSQHDYEAEVARILARSLQDAKYEVTPNSMHVLFPIGDTKRSVKFDFFACNQVH